MMPAKPWEIGGLIFIFLLYAGGCWYVLAKAAHSGWRWYYCAGAGVFIIGAGICLALFIRSTRTM
jgi:hypothetical protein